MILLKNVAKHFGKVRAVDGVSFEVGKGEVIGFLGPNGAGKTTTMRLITGYLRPTAGKIEVDGLEPGKERVAVVERIGYLPENNPLYNEMKVNEYLHFIENLKIQNPKSKQIRNSKFEVQNGEIAKVCGIQDKLDVKIEELSRGYRQRVGLAAAMLGDPEVLILDEPASGLDPNQVVEIRDLIKKLGKEKTVILSTHILQEVEAMCNRVIIIDKGKIVYDSKVPKKGKLEGIFRKVTLGDSRKLGKLSKPVDQKIS